MGRQIGQNLPTPQASRIRRGLIAFLAAAYLLVGFAGEISCAEETLATTSSFGVSAVTGKSDEGSKKIPEVVEHCYTCAPVLISAPVSVSEPLAEPVKLSFDAPMFVLEDHSGLDTPPPKHLT